MGADPQPLPRIQYETIVRLLAADLVGPAAVLEGLPALRDEVQEALAQLSSAHETVAGARAPSGAAGGERAPRGTTAAPSLEWLDEAERTLREREHEPPPA